MIRTFLLLIISLFFTSLTVISFYMTDYPNILRWISYYQECKIMQRDVERGHLSPEEMLSRLKIMLPTQADELEQRISQKYGIRNEITRPNKFSLYDESSDDDTHTNDDDDKEKTSPASDIDSPSEQPKQPKKMESLTNSKRPGKAKTTVSHRTAPSPQDPDSDLDTID